MIHMRPKCSAIIAFLKPKLLCSGWMASSIFTNLLVNNCIIFSTSSGGCGSFSKRTMLCSMAQDWITAIVVSIFKRSPKNKTGNLRFQTPNVLSTTLRVLIWDSLYNFSALLLDLLGVLVNNEIMHNLRLPESHNF